MSQLDLPDTEAPINFVLLSGDRVYTAAAKTLYVYSARVLRDPIATYPLDYQCYSGLIVDNRLYLCS